MLNPYSLVSAKFTIINISYSPGWKDSQMMPYQSIIERVSSILPVKIAFKKIDNNTITLELQSALCFKTNDDLTRLSKTLIVQGQVVTFAFSAHDSFYNVLFPNVNFPNLVKLLLDSPVVSDFRLSAFSNGESLSCNIRLVSETKPHLIFPSLKHFAKKITPEDYLSNNHLFLGESSYVTLRHQESDVIVGKILELNELESFYQSFDRLVLLIQAWDGKNLYITAR